MPSWVMVLIVLIALVGWIIYSIIRDKKQGKSSCSHGCSNCAMHGQCHAHAKAE